MSTKAKMCKTGMTSKKKQYSARPLQKYFSQLKREEVEGLIWKYQIGLLAQSISSIFKIGIPCMKYQVSHVIAYFKRFIKLKYGQHMWEPL